jgi:acetyl-CoA carboxylase/biotin carboxylase 1
VSAVAELSRKSSTGKGKDDAYRADLQERMWSYVRERGGDTLIRRVLIANNGMAATKTIMSIQKWAYKTFGDEHAVEFVVMASAEDLAANAEFIRRADDFIEVPGGPNSNNYANVQLIVDLCISQNVDAVFVGWGHASENPKLGEMLKSKTEELGRKITFVGPTSPVMRVLGDKIGSILLAQKAGVSTMPWNGDGMTADLQADGTLPQAQFDAACIFSIEQAIETANRIGYPVMLKASEGGGGKGIRKADNEEMLRTAYPQVITEVPGSPIFLVSYCSGARHLEVQVVGDKHGNAIALGGRDCSTQRRFQKIFEEGPPLIAPDHIFDQMMRQAVDLCQSIGYQSAGTVEWMYQPADDKFFFLELNPRLQVEHPVTEGITDVSLPGTQLHVAMGIPLYNVPEVRRFWGHDYNGVGEIDLTHFKPSSEYPKHVMAARITAENPDEGFKPTSGKIDRINFQSDTKVRRPAPQPRLGALTAAAASRHGRAAAAASPSFPLTQCRGDS